MINTKLQNIIDTKSAIGNAIVNKGGTITSETPFLNYAAQIDGISTGSVLTGNASANQVFNGQTFYSNDANTQLTGNFIPAQIDGVNESFMPAIGDTASYGGTIFSITTNNGFIYAGGGGGSPVIRKYNESTLSFVNNSVSYGSTIFSIATNNGFVYAGGGVLDFTNRGVTKFHEGNLALSGANLNASSTPNYGGGIESIAINNGFIYAGGEGLGGLPNVVRKYHESNLALNNSTSAYGGIILTIAINDGFIYVGGSTANLIRKYNESNLALVGNTGSYGFVIQSVTTNNGFIYVSGRGNATNGRNVVKYYESNLALVGNTAVYGGDIRSVTTNNGFIYAGGFSNNTVQKFYESNLVFVNNTPTYGANIHSVTINNGFIYAGGVGLFVRKFQESTQFTNSLNGQAWYLIPKE
jgi:hypothetical protein